MHHRYMIQIHANTCKYMYLHDTFGGCITPIFGGKRNHPLLSSPMAHRVRWYCAARRSEAPVAAVLVLRGATAAAAAIGAPLAVYSLLRVGRRLEDLRRVDSVGRRLPPALHRLMPAKPPGRSRPVAPRRLGGSSRVARAALAITGGEGGRVEGASRGSCRLQPDSPSAQVAAVTICTCGVASAAPSQQ